MYIHTCILHYYFSAIFIRRVLSVCRSIPGTYLRINHIIIIIIIIMLFRDVPRAYKRNFTLFCQPIDEPRRDFFVKVERHSMYGFIIFLLLLWNIVIYYYFSYTGTPINVRRNCCWLYTSHKRRFCPKTVVLCCSVVDT